MKIAYVFDRVYPFSKGGVERRTWEMARRHAQKGHQVTIISMKQWEGDSVMDMDGVRVVGVCPEVQVYVKGRRSVGAAIYFGLCVLFPLLRERYDVVNASIFPYFSCISAKMASVVWRSKLVFSCWELWGSYWGEYVGRIGAIGKMVERFTVKLPDWIVVETEDTRRGLKVWGFDPSRVTLVPSGVDNEAVQSVPSAGEDDAADVIYVGRLTSYKGVRTLVEAVGVLKGRGKSVKASIVGDGPQREELQRLAEELGVGERVKFYGRVEDGKRVVALMKAAKMFVYPAAPLGGWALTPLEANAAGLPVITTRAGPVLGSTDVVQDGRNGLLLDKLTPEAMATKIAVLVDDEGLRERLSKQALEFAREYDWDSQTGKVEAIYSGLTAGTETLKSCGLSH
ncbi:MAG: glycosyltransferase family 4 protein [Nitrososphaerota archaeon]|nr:glycosyltransferase family 4 protein [Nitrososphaerota archaeon]MDG6958290.1 glycosyltransferase family 4 protein [Nitrososphaerota archaeon]MDG6977364.1 glycosyltransferase family 4 protein [Nitrososphaerota archaeon]MDG6979506.1 glycosyltransferase family 4 protein [Nitrososphaerota archaeon]MDG6983755.1 glycosyltransferase family 4 protein [Nitrososphaerota archaeon]